MDDHDLAEWSHDDEGWRWWACRCGVAEGPFPDDETAVDAFGSHVASTLVARIVRAEDAAGLDPRRSAEIARLQRWKSEATAVLEAWGNVADAVPHEMRDRPLGSSVPLSVAAEVRIMALRHAALRAVIAKAIADLDFEHQPSTHNECCYERWPCPSARVADDLRKAIEP